jgi:predicted O-methyltransferase YrrM
MLRIFDSGNKQTLMPSNSESEQVAPLKLSGATRAGPKANGVSTNGLDASINKYLTLDEETRGAMKRRSSALDELMYIALLLRANQVRNFIEIGTFLGQSACILAPCISGTYYTINKSLPEVELARKYIAAHGIKNVQCICGDSLEMLPDVLEKSADQLDGVYIDGWHSYTYAMREYQLSEPYLTHGGPTVAIFDDAHKVHPDSKGDGGVPRAVIESGATPVPFLAGRIAVKAFNGFRVL